MPIDAHIVVDIQFACSLLCQGLSTGLDEDFAVKLFQSANSQNLLALSLALSECGKYFTPDTGFGCCNVLS